MVVGEGLEDITGWNKKNELGWMRFCGNCLENKRGRVVLHLDGRIESQQEARRRT